MSDKDLITLISCENTTHILKLEVACVSPVLEKLLTDKSFYESKDKTVSLPFKGHIVSNIVEYMEEMYKKHQIGENIGEFDAKEEDLLQLLDMANYLKL